MCECTGPGYCPRHDMDKSRHLFNLCQDKSRGYWRAWENKRGPMSEVKRDPEAPKITHAQKEDLGRKLWRQIHTYSNDNRDAWDSDKARRFFANWNNKVPNHGCPCKKNWRKILEDHPVDLSGPDEFFAWSVAVHNVVNEKLKKPIVSLEEAKQIHKEE